MADQRCSSGVVCKGERPAAGSVGIGVSEIGGVEMVKKIFPDSSRKGIECKKLIVNYFLSTIL